MINWVGEFNGRKKVPCFEIAGMPTSSSSVQIGVEAVSVAIIARENKLHQRRLDRIIAIEKEIETVINVRRSTVAGPGFMSWQYAAVAFYTYTKRPPA